MWVIQYAGAEGAIDLGWGCPDPELLPVEQWAEATGAALLDTGWTTLTYGYADGPGPLREWLSAHLGTVDGRAPESAQVFVTASASQGFDLLCSVLTRPGTCRQNVVFQLSLARSRRWRGRGAVQERPARPPTGLHRISRHR